MPGKDGWLPATLATLDGYRRMIDAAVDQLSDQQLRARPTPEMNSVAVLIRHLGGNLHSRWTDFLTADGEKPDRDRDREFEDWPGDRASLMSYFDAGWNCLCESLARLQPEDMSRTVTIRGESLSIPLAIQRSITHISYHVGQLVMVARWAYGNDNDWKWLTIQPGGSALHNERTWGTSASRGVAGGTAEDR